MQEEDHAESQGDEQSDAAGKPVDAVDEVHGVDHAHDEDYRNSNVGDLGERGFAFDERHAGQMHLSHKDDDAGDDKLQQQPDNGRGGRQVVFQRHKEEQYGRRCQGAEFTVVADNLEEQDTKEKACEDADAAQVGDVLGVDFAGFGMFVEQQSLDSDLDDAGHGNTGDDERSKEE